MIRFFLLIVLILSVLTVFGQTEKKFQIWNKNDVSIQPWKNIDIDVAEKIHYSSNHNALDLKYGELFLSHKPLKWMDYGAGFRVSKSNLYPGWLLENRSMLIVDFMKNYHLFGFKYSNRFEYRDFDKEEDYFRYRQQFTVNFPSLTSWGMRFYSAEETFFKLNGDGLHLARFYAGLSALQKEHFNLKMYYAHEKYTLAGNWKDGEVLGFNMSVIL